MILIEEIIQQEMTFKFYNGIDFNVLINHAKDGSDGFIFCFMDSWEKELKIYNRDNKIKSVVENTEYDDFEWDIIDNNYVVVYQTDGISIDLLYRAIRDKVINSQIPSSPYLNITEANSSGIINSGGAWKIEKRVIDG